MNLFRLCLALTVLLGVGPARAQLTPGPGPGMGRQPPKKTESKEGPAEAAPEEKDEDQPELPPLPPWPGQETKKLQLFQLGGYFRFRVDMFHNLNLGMLDQAGLKAPFFTPISEDPASGASCAGRKGKPTPGGGERDLEDDDCPANTLAGANMRLRLEPTINIGEQVRVHVQLDVFDTLSLGSTPDRRSIGDNTTVPLDAFTASQAPPVAGQNSPKAAILVKRAWGEVETPFGEMRFGRTPLHWGVGLMANDGSCWDCDFGDNADRFSFQTNLAGYTLGMSYDFASSGPTSLDVVPGISYYGGQAIDLEQLDDVIQLTWIAGKIEDEEVIRDKVDRGQLVLNYGLYLVWRQQDFDYARLVSAAGTSAAGPGFGSTKDGWASAFMERHYWSIMPDIWFKLLWKKLYVEFEGAFIGGKIENAAYDLDNQRDYDILQFAWVVRSSYRMLKDSLRVGLEIGMASGDQAEPNNADVSRNRWHPLGLNADGTAIDGDGTLREFRFNPDYHVDLILFRELLGTVANAVYFKPWVQYLIVDSFGARLDAIYAMAHEPTAFPGNSRHLGLEFDLDVFYQNIEEKFFAGLQYGILIPFGALDRAAEIYGSANAADAGVAHTLQLRLRIQF
jgi:uncharacterized protein (TIGR04551 family)